MVAKLEAIRDKKLSRMKEIEDRKAGRL